MTRQAVECFRAQKYANKRLLIWDTGARVVSELESEEEGIFLVPVVNVGGRASIGELRNSAIRFWTEFQIIVHWDSDDISHPDRIAEQVELLTSTGADCVGYSDMLFWRADDDPGCEIRGTGEAWLYTAPPPHYPPLGTSLCYWRKTWERTPFAPTSVGEDERFVRSCGKVVSQSSLAFSPGGAPPRMIARIHPGNTSPAYAPRAMAKSKEWQRVPHWDNYRRGIFA
jgi:glycosyltransferase involved in cell wall biosynthesis